MNYLTLAGRVAARLDTLRHKGKSQAGLARHCGIKPPSVSKWLSGETKKLAGMNLINAAEYLECSERWLDSGSGPMELSGASELAVDGNEPNIVTRPRPIQVWDDEDKDTENDDETIEVPQLNLTLSAGTGRLQWEIDDTGKRRRYAKSWLIRERLNPEKLVTVVVRGDSMLPGIPDNCKVTLDTSATHIRNGKVHAVDYLGDFFFKRIFKQPDGSVVLQSDNEDKRKYPDIHISIEHMGSLRILGAPVDVNWNARDY